MSQFTRRTVLGAGTAVLASSNISQAQDTGSEAELLARGTITLDVPIAQSPVKAALDAFYDFVKDIAPPGESDRIAILGTIVNFDIHQQARLYNDYVVRAFSDRTVLVSPVAAQGAGDRADRYSSRYIEMLRLLLAGLDVKMSAEDKAQVARHKAAIRAISDDRDKWLERIEEQWARKMRQLGIDPAKIDTDEQVRQRYLVERVIFMTQRRFAQTLQEFNDDIDSEQQSIDDIRISAFPDVETRTLTELYKVARSERVVRPKRPDLELKYGWDEITIQNPDYFSIPAVFDIAPAVESIVDPRTILNGGGSRGFDVSTSTTETHAHDREWGVSGSGSYMPFIRGSFNSNDTRHFRQTLARVRNVSVNFEHVGELQLSRGGWFSSTIFEGARVTDYLKKNKTLAKKLSLLTTGLIIGRGLSLTLKFTDRSDVAEWGSTTRSGSGGISVFGVSLGGGGSSSSSWENRQIDEANQTVTFKDSSNVCRLLGLRVTELAVPISRAEVARGARRIDEVPAFAEAAQRLGSRHKVLDEASLTEAAMAIEAARQSSPK